MKSSPMKLIYHIKPFIDEESFKGRPVTIDKVRRHLEQLKVDFAKNPRSLVRVMNDYTANASQEGRPQDTPKHFYRVDGDSWISIQNLPAYEKWIGGPIKIKAYT